MFDFKEVRTRVPAIRQAFMRAAIRDGRDSLREVRPVVAGAEGSQIPTVPIAMVPAFSVLVMLERDGNRAMAWLEWELLGGRGRYAVIPRSEIDVSSERTANMRPWPFSNDRDAKMEAMEQAQILRREFVAWATGQPDQQEETTP